MALSNSRPNTSYGYPSPQLSLFPDPISLNRAPNGFDQGVIGQVVVDNSVTPGQPYMLSNYGSGATAGQSNWIALTSSGGSGSFSTLTVTGTSSLYGLVTAGAGLTATMGNITATAGNIVATDGNITALGAGAFISTYGNVTTTMGNLVAGTTDHNGVGYVVATNINGTGIPTTGLAIGNATSAAVTGAGAYTIQSTASGATNRTNDGFLTFYQNGAARYVPYWLTITG